MRKLTAGGGNGQRGRPTDKPSGAQADALIIAYLEKTGTATISNIADGIDIPKYTVNSRAEILVAQGVLKRLEDRATGFKTTPGPKPYLYSLTEKARLPD
jgi:predicted ArsR family transcriptional regulator